MSAELQKLFQDLPKLRDVRINGPSAHAHSVVVPYATYSPWLEDPAFAESFASVRGNTLVDRYRAFELWSLVAQTARLGGDILEVGVWRGGTGCLMAAQAKRVAPGARVILCDTFAGVVKAGAQDTVYRGGEHADASAQMVLDLAARMGLDNIDIKQGIFPDETGAGVADRRLALCHIDVDVYESAAHVLDWAWPRLIAGGVAVFDDYGFSTCDGVTRLVNERALTPGGVALHNLNGHALIVKTA